VGRIHCRAVYLALALFLLAGSNAAFGGKKAPKLAETIDLPQTFELDFQFAAKQREQLGSQRAVPDDIAGRVGEDVFESLVKTEMISGFRLPYTWTFRPYDSPDVNAFSLPDGEVVAFTGLSRLIGTNRGLWAAVLAHEIAHVARRHAVRKALFHEYVEQQVRYWQMRARLGERGAGWTALGVRVAGNLAEKKLSRDLEHDADIQGMLLMARAGYHPDNAFAMHHLLRMNTPERSRIGTFFLSDHPRWESRDQRTERAYTDALAEYTRLWASPDSSPGGAPPAVAFLGDVRGMENKGGSTGDLTLALSCRNVGSPVALVVHLTKGDGSPVRSMVGEYRDSTGNVLIHERASCLDKDGAVPTIVHIPTAIIAAQDRKLKAQVEVLGPSDEVLERSRSFDVHFPKTASKSTMVVAKVRVEPELGDTPGAEQADQSKVADAVVPVAIQLQRPSTAAPWSATRVEPPTLEAAAPVPTRAERPTTGVDMAPAAPRAALTKGDSPSNHYTRESLGVLPSALDGSGRPSHWGNSLAPTGVAATWWHVSPAAEPTPTISVSRSDVFFPIEPVDTESLPAKVLITNITPASLTFSGVTISGNDPSDFSQTTDCGHTIDTGAICTLSLIFRPTANGTRTGLLSVEGTTQIIRLTGIGN
jgi:hypothetical protein